MPTFNLTTIIQLAAAAVGIAETFVPIFVHNPKSQQIAAVIMTDVNSVLAAFGAAPAAPPAAPPAAK